MTSAWDQLQKFVDGGPQILKPDEDGLCMVGYISANELKHALSIVADEPDEIVSSRPAGPHGHLSMSAAFSSLTETGSNVFVQVPFDLSCYMDQAPLRVQQFSTDVGAKYLVLMDTEDHRTSLNINRTYFSLCMCFFCLQTKNW